MNKEQRKKDKQKYLKFLHEIIRESTEQDEVFFAREMCLKIRANTLTDEQRKLLDEMIEFESQH